MTFTTAQIAKLLQGEVVGDGNAVLKNFAPAENAQADDLTFAENENYFTRAEQSAAEGLGLSRGAPIVVREGTRRN